ncbi:MAG TPA: DUF6456 domain-containing protein [Caulobacterales bacterium]|nr:DUF6456 domain-containing protein [Caulobacterales bacterium]
MSVRGIGRALARLAAPEAVLAGNRDGVGFGVYLGGDRRRRPVARLSAAEVKALSADGVLAPLPEKGAFVLSEAGRARLRRQEAPEAEGFIAQHAPMIERVVVDADGDVRRARAVVAGAGLKRLAMLRDARGAPWLNPAELAAATRLREDWERGQIGLVRGSDWSAPPRGGSARGPGNAQEMAVGATCDARRRVEQALALLAPPLRRVVERICLAEEGLEALERAEGWPARSGKIALKLGLAQLAAASPA